ncbi:hypothetical protein TA3x_001584 [Tundrisphaera sp. TA3]|uniref:hypothetical protein n=1 Tax=Tundrisphaera sp. TA3 TaxID=3435775 RepID=UPI003EBB927F
MTYDLATLTYKEILRATLRFRHPKPRNPVAVWVASVIYVLFACAVMGFFVGMATWPRFKPEPLAAIFAMLGLAMPYRVLTQVSRAGKGIRGEGLCTTEFTPEGVLRRTSIVEIRYRWVPGQRFSLVGDDLLIFAHKDQMLWLPLRVFSSPSEAEAFLESGRIFHAKAMADAMIKPTRSPAQP